MGAALELERFAALSAEIEAGAARAEVLAREGIAPDDWEGAQAEWLGKMAEEAAAKRFELTNRYNTAFVARRRALQDGRRGPGRGARPAKTATPKAAPPAQPQAATSTPAPPHPPPQAGLPSFMMESAAPVTSLPVVTPPPITAPPPVVAPPVIAAPPPTAEVPPPPRQPTKEEFGATTAEPLISPFARSPPLPFHRSSGAEPPPARSPSPAAPLGGLPFHAASPGAAAPPADATPAAAPHPPAPAAHEDLGATTVAVSPFAQGAPLPFRSGPSDAAPTAPPGQPATAPLPPIRPASQQASVLPFHASSGQPPAKLSTTSGTPFRAPTAAPTPTPAAPSGARFSLEQFASLGAEIAAAPAKIAEVRARYGIDEASHRREAEEWNRRFSADQELYRRYGSLFQSYRDWLSRTPR